MCLKKTLWDVDEETPLDIDRGEGEIPCPEPCSVFVSFARRVRLFEREERTATRRVSRPRSGRTCAALVEAAATGEVGFAREAEFEEPLNERRMRYRRLTLVPRLPGMGSATFGTPESQTLPPTMRCSPSWFAGTREAEGGRRDKRKLLFVRGDAARDVGNAEDKCEVEEIVKRCPASKA